MEGFCLDRFIKQVNVSSFYDNGGGDVHQYNDTIREFHLHLSDSNVNETPVSCHYIGEHHHYHCHKTSDIAWFYEAI